MKTNETDTTTATAAQSTKSTVLLAIDKIRPNPNKFPGIKNRGIKKCKAKDNQIIIHFSSVPLF